MSMYNKQKETHNWLTGLLTGWGIKDSWAKLIAGAVVGALTAAGLLTSCEQVQRITPEQVQRWHKAAHVATGTECECRIIQVKEVEK